MTDFRKFKISAAVRAKMPRLGLDAEAVKKMARESMQFTHPDFNRRFEGYLMLTQGDLVVDIARYVSEPRRRLRETPLKGTLEKTLKLLEQFVDTEDGVCCLTDDEVAEIEGLIDEVEKQLKKGV